MSSPSGRPPSMLRRSSRCVTHSLAPTRASRPPPGSSRTMPSITAPLSSRWTLTATMATRCPTRALPTATATRWAPPPHARPHHGAASRYPTCPSAAPQVAGVRATRDPVERTKRYCFETGLVSEAEVKEIEKAVKAEVSEAVEYAKVNRAACEWPPRVRFTHHARPPARHRTRRSPNPRSFTVTSMLASRPTSSCVAPTSPCRTASTVSLHECRAQASRRDLDAARRPPLAIAFGCA